MKFNSEQGKKLNKNTKKIEFKKSYSPIYSYLCIATLKNSKIDNFPQIIKAGGNSWYKFKLVLLFFLWFSILHSQDKNQSSLYLGNIELGNGISKDKETKLRNSITLSIIRKYKEKFRIIDDETVKNLLNRLKIQQQTGCSTEKCERMIDDALNADYKITGNLVMETGGKIALTLKLFHFKDMNPSLENQVEKSFTLNQLEYYISELTWALVDSRYTINEKNAPSELELGKVDLSKISIKEVSGSDLKIIEFKTSEDTEINDIISGIKPILAEGDLKFKQKNYTDALINYRVILKQLRKVGDDKKSKLAGYTESITKRMEQAINNIYSSKINSVDKDLNRKKDLNREEADTFVKSYDELRRSYEAEIGTLSKSEEILNGILERTEKIDVSNFTNQEKLADSLYDSYKFSPAISEYTVILNRLNKKPNTQTYNSYRERIKTKIETTRVTGTSFIKNKFTTYVTIAKSKNPVYGGFKDTKKEKEADELESIIKDALLGAKNILITSEFSDDSMLREYNQLVTKINSDNREYSVEMGTTLDRSKLRSGEIETVGIDYPFFHFPGVPQREKELLDKKNGSLKSNTFIYGGYASLALTGFGALMYYSYNASYSGTTGTSPILYYFLSQSDSTPGFGFLLLSLDQAKFNTAYNKVESASGMVNSGAGLFGIFVLLSHLDLLTTTKTVDTLGKLDGIPLYQLERGGFSLHARNQFISPIPRTGMEMQYSLEYNYRF